MGIGEIIVILVIALIVIPPEKLPDVMRATGKVLRELRLASNLVVHELSSAIEEPRADRPNAGAAVAPERAAAASANPAPPHADDAGAADPATPQS